MIAIEAKKTARLAKAIGRFSHRSGATIGASWRRSCQMKAIVATMKKTSATSVVSENPLSTSVSAIISAEMEMANSPAPKTSIETDCGRFSSCRKITKPSAARSPTGTLIQKIQAQGRLWMMMLPRSGPTTADRAQTLAR